MSDSNADLHGLEPWIGIDHDRTACTYTSWEEQNTALGEPILPVIVRAQLWRQRGYKIKVFTARAASTSPRRDHDIGLIQDWWEKHAGFRPEVTAEKDFACIMIVDDLAYPVLRNVGTRVITPNDAEAAFLPPDPLDLPDEMELVNQAWLERTLADAESRN